MPKSGIQSFFERNAPLFHFFLPSVGLMPKDDIENCSVILGVKPFDKIEMGPVSVTQGLQEVSIC